jgi:hypothetical protein
MRRLPALLCLVVIVSCTSPIAPPVPEDPNPDGGEEVDPDDGTGQQTNANTIVSAGVGINLSAVNYFATQLPFSNLFLSRDAWMSTTWDAWDTEQIATIPANADGYALELPYGELRMRAPAFLPIHADTFEMTWKGDGEFHIQAPGYKLLELTETSLRFSVDASLSDSVFIRIDRSTPGNYVHDIEIRGQRDYGAEFRKSLKGFGVLRFMDWGATNHSPVKTWSERTLPKLGQGSEHGVAIEHMIDTANAVQAHMWFTVPHQADDDYMQRAAQLIAERLDKRLNVFIEYSNENWNGIFSQVQWEQKQGLALGYDEFRQGKTQEETEFWAGTFFAVQRAAYLHSVFRRALGERAVTVLSGQSANPGLNEAILAAYEDTRINPLGGKPDALAVAPYFGRVYREREEVAGLTVDRILADAEESIAELVTEHTSTNRDVADEHGVHLIAYEAGQHVLLTGGLEEDEPLLEMVIAANRDPRMGDLYRKAHKAWLAAGGELIVYFNSCEQPGKFGSWGAREYQDQPLSEAPKWAALQSMVQ